MTALSPAESAPLVRTVQVGEGTLRFEAGESVAVLDTLGQQVSLTWSSAADVVRALHIFCSVLHIHAEGDLSDDAAMVVREADGVSTWSTGASDVFRALSDVDSHRFREPELVRLEGSFDGIGYLALSLSTEGDGEQVEHVISMTTPSLDRDCLRRIISQTAEHGLVAVLEERV